ncbi:MAG: hypothetical protein ACPGDC_08860 [Synechococcus sp.]
MFEGFNRQRRRRKPGEFRSKLEQQVSAQLQQLGLPHQYETEKFRYTLTRRYTPDFKVGDVYIEVKGWWPPEERTKFLAVVFSNPELRIFVALQRPLQAINKQSSTSYAAWCQKHGIPWCPIPIPSDFLQQWIDGQRPSFHVPIKGRGNSLKSTNPAPSAPHQTLLPFEPTDQGSASPAANTSHPPIP